MLCIILKGIERVTKICHCHLLKSQYEKVMTVFGLKYRKKARIS